MGGYDTLNYIRSWFRVGFGLVIAVLFYVVFQSFFMLILTVAFFCYFPIPNERTEYNFSTIMFTILMGIVLLLAFLNSETMGLGLDLGLAEFTQGQMISLVILGLAFLARVIFSVSSQASGAEMEVFENITTFALIILLLWNVYFLEVWNWNSSAMVFVGIWTVAFLSGAFAHDVESRQVFGTIMIGMSFILFTMGVGSQEVGSSFFGQWWPTVFQAGSQVFGPLQSTLSQVTGGLGTGMKLLTDPTGFAQQIMNGSFGKDPTTGLVGAYGLELEQFTSTPIFVGQPYSLSMMVKNRGAFEARNVWVAIVPGWRAAGGATYEKDKEVDVKRDDKIPLYIKVPMTEQAQYLFVPGGKEKEAGMKLSDMGFKDNDQKCPTEQPYVCYQNVSDKMAKLDLQQVFFQSNGFGCKAVNKYGLKKKFTPIKGYVQYDYGVESQLSVEFMETGEWDRRVQEGRFVTQAKRPSTITNAPVKLSVDTMEQPIREGNRFFVGLQLASARTGETKLKNVKVEMEIPEGIEFKTKDNIKDSCSPGDGKKVGNRYVWEFKKEPYVILCQFKAIKLEANEPTKTFLIRANASYTFSESRDLVTKLEFGGKACCKTAKDCPIPAAQDCDTNTEECVQKGAVTEPGEPSEPAPTRDLDDFCSDWPSKFAKAAADPVFTMPLGLTNRCLVGWGECGSKNECNIRGEDMGTLQWNPAGEFCRSITGVPVKICCPQPLNPADRPEMVLHCKSEYQVFIKNTDIDDVLAAGS